MKNKPSEELLEVAQEITFAKALASNDKTLRDKALRRLRRWITSKSESSKSFTDEGLVRLWRGLFYNVWMSDKPLIQEEVVEGIGNLVHCFKEFPEALAFIKCFLQTLSENWFGLDSFRFDKYLMFVRRFLRHSFLIMTTFDWRKENVLALVEIFEKSFSKAPLGFLMHVSEIYLEELAKVSKGDLDKTLLTEFIKPFGSIMSRSSDVRLINHIRNYIYVYLLKQSDLGIKHELKFNAWKKMGFPEGDINVIQEVEMNSDEEVFDEIEGGNASLDARAGHVDVVLPLLKFDTSEIVNHLTMLKKKSDTTTRARKSLTDIVKKYKTFERGKYPLGIHRVDVVESEDEDELVEQAAIDLWEEELEIYQKEKGTSKKNSKKQEKSNRGEWLVTPTKQDQLQNGKTSTRRSVDIHNNWQVSSQPHKSNVNNQAVSSCLPVEAQELNVNKKNKHKRKKKQSTILDVSKPSNNEIVNRNKKIKTANTSSDWGNVTWDDEQESEIIIGHKSKLSSDSFSQLKEVNFRKNSLSGTPGSGKKVEFVLNRNSFQDEEDYKRRLKKKPVIKFDGDLQPSGGGVLKLTPFSSPVNPFILSPTNVQ